MSVFDACVALLLEREGGFTLNREDPGNWTGGAVGVGALNGTNWGISAASYPTLNIKSLSQDQAAAIYRERYWNPVCCDDLPAALALVVFDASVNNGADRAARWLQLAAGVAQDGQIGVVTLAAVQARDATAVATEFMAQRIAFMAALPAWKVFGLGWARRLAALPFQALQIQASINDEENPP